MQKNHTQKTNQIQSSISSKENTACVRIICKAKWKKERNRNEQPHSHWKAQVSSYTTKTAVVLIDEPNRVMCTRKNPMPRHLAVTYPVYEPFLSARFLYLNRINGIQKHQELCARQFFFKKPGALKTKQSTTNIWACTQRFRHMCHTLLWYTDWSDIGRWCISEPCTLFNPTV